jgi:glutamate racemase
VFDSGIGGLSILKALRTELPHEDFVYVADSGHAPYGERDDAYVIARTQAITDYLTTVHHIKALVIACNTATAAAIEVLRQTRPTLPIVGVEPALKPAVAQSKTRRIAVLATRGTLESAKFRALLASLATQAEFVCQSCDGLADAIEREDTPKIRALCTYYMPARSQFGLKMSQIDTLVLGCTHYAFASAELRELAGPEVQVIDNGAAVALQTRRVMGELSGRSTPGHCLLFSTGDGARLQQAAHRWLNLEAPAQHLVI